VRTPARKEGYSVRPVPMMIEKTEDEDNNKKLNR
jgi:hypothetical protein